MIYEGETNRNMDIRRGEHEDTRKNSQPSKHLRANADHSFTWSILRKAHSYEFKRKILESFFICKFEPSLNSQIEHTKLLLYRNGIT